MMPIGRGRPRGGERLRPKEGSELMDREIATKVKVPHKDGWKSYLAIAWEIEVATITDTRGA